MYIVTYFTLSSYVMQNSLPADRITYQRVAMNVSKLFAGNQVECPAYVGQMKIKIGFDRMGQFKQIGIIHNVKFRRKGSPETRFSIFLITNYISVKLSTKRHTLLILGRLET